MMSYDTNLYLLLIYPSRREVLSVKMERVIIQLPVALKRKLDALRAQGYTAAGYIRSLLERELTRERVRNKRGDP